MLESTDNFPVATITEPLIGLVVDVFRDKPDRTIAQEEMRTTCVARLETLARLPILPVVAALRNAIPCNTIQGILADTGNRVVDRGRRRNPQTVEVKPAVARVIAALRTDLTGSNCIGCPSA